MIDKLIHIYKKKRKANKIYSINYLYTHKIKSIQNMSFLASFFPMIFDEYKKG